MVRFKVIKGSHVLFVVSVIVLITVLLILIFGSTKQQGPAKMQNSSIIKRSLLRN